ncbi:hypothetical protein SAMN05421538_101260 [Paracoccus isoporae]|uniref:Inner membrane protein n=1 Tax=Paracoccus isoporae TaxID=591205 RepID=A0A1G6TG36_9RHOB|nr:hypothetical protein [Paracoccus isoporae]SDD27315.1 hypothetical protein SAMN05421538_101260 [Paracoccus isoporae]
MATSGKSSKNDTKPETKTGGTAKAPSQKPVVTSSPAEPGETTVSRIPPSQPIESTLVGKPDGKTEAAQPKTAVAKDADKAAPAGRVTDSTAASRTETNAAPAGTPVRERDLGSAANSKSGGGGFWPLALGGVVAAGLGAAAAVYVLPQISPQPDLDSVTSEAVSAATEAAQAEIGAIRDSLVSEATETASLAGSEAGALAAQDIIAEMPQGADTTTELQAALQAQADKIAELESALSAQAAAAPQPADRMPDAVTVSAASPDTGSSALAAEIETLRQRLAAQEETISELTSRPQVDPEAIERVQSLAQNAEQVRSDIEAAAADARERLEAVQSEADAATQRAQAVASVAALGAALERGGSPTEAVEQLEEAGVDVPEPLAQEDLPTLDQVQMGYDAASRAALRASLQADGANGGAVSAVGNFLRLQTGARSVEPREGDDPDAVLSRAGALVAQGDLSTALDELQALPPEGQEAMADWTAQTEAYLAAEAALNDVANTLN